MHSGYSLNGVEESTCLQNLDLGNAEISWADTSNADWYEQFIKVMNAAFGSNTKFGKPVASDTVNGILTRQYNVQSSPTEVPIFAFSSLPLSSTSKSRCVTVNVTSLF